MGRPLQKLQRFFRELKRRNVYKVAVAYLAVAFVGLQAAQLLVPATTLPAWADDLLIYLAVFGFPLALVIAWAFEMTPEGVRRTADAGPGEPAEDEREGSAGRTGIVYRVLIGLGLVAATVAGGWYLTAGGGESPEISEGTVAVLPFQVSGSGAEEWRDGMVSLLSTNLDGAGGLRTIADRTVFAALEEVDSAGRGTSTEEALAVARGVGAEYAVVGSASQLGGELQLTARLHETQSGDRLEQVEVRGPPDSVTSMTDSLTRRMLAVLLEGSEEGIPSVDLASLTTQDLQALKSLLAGERHLRAGDYAAAAEDYRAAVASDTAFALAHARLALSYWWAGKHAAEKEAWRRAEAFAHRLPRRERRLVRALYLARTRERSGWGADTLRRLTDAYPDDPTVWYSLGEVLWHEDVPGGWPEADTAFARAVELDPGHALYYPHYAQLAIAVHHDSALTARRVAEMPEPKLKDFYRIPLHLAFGDSAGRRAALARVDSVPLSEMLGVGPRYALRHPEEGDAYRTVLGRILKRSGRDRTSANLFRASLDWGQVADALARLDTLPVNAELAGCYLSASLSLGLPVPDSVARSYLDPPALPDDASWRRIRCAGVYLVETGRAEELDALLPRIRQAARLGEEDSVGLVVKEAIDGLEAYRAWKAGNPERAVRLFSDVSRTGRHGSIWRGDVYHELGRLEEAERWYLAAWTHPVAHERLGQLYEEMNRPEKAASAYRRFIAAWENADEELQPRVEKARERLQALTASEAEPDE